MEFVCDYTLPKNPIFYIMTSWKWVLKDFKKLKIAPDSRGFVSIVKTAKVEEPLNS